MGRLDGKVAVITGSARGQGEAHARRFVAEGAQVILGDVLDDLGQAVAADLGGAASYRHHDVRDEDHWRAAVAEAEERFGKLDVLVNNAGVLDMSGPTHEITLDAYRRVIDINQVGTFLGMRHALPAMLRNRGGSIVNISSTGGLRAFGGTVAYTASKFAVRGMTKAVAVEYGKANIRANSVHPGAVDTPMIRPDELGAMTPEEQEAAFAGLPLARPARPDDISQLVVFLASDDSSYCTGAEFLIDGGALAGDINPHAEVRLD